MTAEITSVPNAPTRRMDQNDEALVNAAKWHEENTSGFRLEDKVSFADSKAAFLQGLVVYVGPVHFSSSIHVGVQLTGPSIGRGFCDGTYQGKKYFAGVGRNNGALIPLSKISKRLNETGAVRQSEDARMADLEFIDCLVEARAKAMLKLAAEKSKRSGIFGHKKVNEIYIQRLKSNVSEDELRSGELPVPSHTDVDKLAFARNKYAGPSAKLSDADIELVEGLERTQQNFCLSDPSLPDNPITYASQPFLNMTGYSLNEILGKNCRFLQKKGATDPYDVYRVRQSIQEGSDCHVCLLNMRKDGTIFHNRLFMTALRDTKGRIKNYLGVQCEVSKEVADKINAKEKASFQAKERASSSTHLILDSQAEPSESWEHLSVTTAALKSPAKRSQEHTSATRMSVPVEKGMCIPGTDSEMTEDGFTVGSSSSKEEEKEESNYVSQIEKAYLAAAGDDRFFL